MPEDLRQITFAEYGVTVLHPLALILTLVMIFTILKIKSENIFLPILLTISFITSLQRLVIGSLDFTMIRLLLIALVVRAVLRKDYKKINLQNMDYFFILYVLITSVSYVILWQTSSSVANRLGFLFDTLLAYFSFRIYINSFDQLMAFVRSLAFIMLIISITMLIEQLTGYNFFSIFGGVSPITTIREGRLRSQGAFSHSILAGTFGAVFFSLFWSLKSSEKRKNVNAAYIGMISSVIVVFTSSSSGPVLSLLSSFVGILFWNYRKYIRQLLLLSILGIILLDFIMNAPVWHLLARIDIVGGSTGWHRYALIDATFNNFLEWALIGVKTTGHWGWGLNDVTNMYVLQAVRGGVFSFFFFIMVIIEGFRNTSQVFMVSQSIPILKHSWGWGVALFVHCISFIGVSYFGQMDFIWYISLAIICTLPEISSQKSGTELSLDKKTRN